MGRDMTVGSAQDNDSLNHRQDTERLLCAACVPGSDRSLSFPVAHSPAVQSCSGQTTDASYAPERKQPHPDALISSLQCPWERSQCSLRARALLNSSVFTFQKQKSQSRTNNPSTHKTGIPLPFCFKLPPTHARNLGVFLGSRPFLSPRS